MRTAARLYVWTYLAGNSSSRSFRWSFASKEKAAAIRMADRLTGYGIIGLVTDARTGKVVHRSRS